MRSTILISVISLLMTANASVAQESKLPDAADAFSARQQDLINLAGYLGSLHRYRQICGTYGDPDLYRNRMRELVPLESPMASTREAMIDSFNTNYRAVSNMHLSCSQEARAQMTEASQSALVITERLFRSFR